MTIKNAIHTVNHDGLWRVLTYQLLVLILN